MRFVPHLFWASPSPAQSFKMLKLDWDDAGSDGVAPSLAISLLRVRLNKNSNPIAGLVVPAA